MDRDSAGFSFDDLAEGQAQLAYTIKVLVYKSDSELFERLDLNDDHVFLEPLLFSYFNATNPSVRLHQILFGYIDPDKRPIDVRSYADDSGIVHVPRIGYLQTSYPAQELSLSWDNIAEECVLELNGQRISYTLTRPIYVQGTDIEVRQYNHPLLTSYYNDTSGTLVDVEVRDVTIRHLDSVSRALDVLRACCPGYYNEVLAVARMIVVFENDEVRSFATLGAHGTAFLSAGRALDDVFFVAEVVHQFGHNILNAVLFKIEDYLRVDPGTPVMGYTHNDSDHRTVLSALHGLYTTTKTAECLDAVYGENIYSGRAGHELVGRLADNRDRVTTGLEYVDRSELFTERAESLFARMKNVCYEVYRRRSGLVDRLDTSNQPFVFDYELFAERNPTEA